MKSMNYLYKHAAAISAAVILLQGVGTGLPAPKLIPLGTVRSAADFSAMLTRKPNPLRYCAVIRHPDRSSVTADPSA